jgi:hypothetical protein
VSIKANTTLPKAAALHFQNRLDIFRITSHFGFWVSLTRISIRTNPKLRSGKNLTFCFP